MLYDTPTQAFKILKITGEDVMKNDFIKQSINFLEYPLWFQDDRLAEKLPLGQVWSDREGYVYRSGYKIPVKTDGIFLLYLLLQSQSNNYAESLSLTRYQIIKECGKTISKVWYDRLEESLNRWLRVDISFKGSFYDGQKYSNMAFHIINSWKLNENTKKLEVTFSPEFLQMMRGRRFFKYINFTEFKRLDSSLATRLYELLSKTFHGRDSWEIEAMKLAKKIPLALKYPSDVIVKIKVAINRINKYTKLQILFSTRQKERGKAILIFSKLPTEKQSKLIVKQPTFDESLADSEFKQVLNVLPAEKQQQKTIIEIIQKFYKQFGADYVIRNIKYTNKSSTKNYRSYLLKALKSDWGIIIEEDQEERALQAQLLKLKKKKEEAQIQSDKKEEAKQKELELQAKDYIANLSKQKLEMLREEALETLDPQIVDLLLSAPKTASGIASRMALKSKMLTIAKDRLSFR